MKKSNVATNIINLLNEASEKCEVYYKAGDDYIGLYFWTDEKLANECLDKIKRIITIRYSQLVEHVYDLSSTGDYSDYSTKIRLSSVPNIFVLINKLAQDIMTGLSIPVKIIYK